MTTTKYKLYAHWYSPSCNRWIAAHSDYTADWDKAIAIYRVIRHMECKQLYIVDGDNNVVKNYFGSAVHKGRL